MQDYKLITRRLFSDWQMPDFLPEVYLDIETFVDKMVEIGAGSIDFTSKSAFGISLYPTKVGFPNKAISGDQDIFGKLCKLAKSKGLEVFAYYNVLLNDAMYNLHPEWMQCDKDGNPLLFEGYKMFCMNSPYREHVFAQIQEIASLYNIDGFDLDIQYFHHLGCFCPWCKEKFRNQYGYDLDISNFLEMQNWIDLHNFQKNSRKDLIWTIVDKAEEVHPDLRWYWNHGGRFSDFCELDSRSTILASEAHPPQYIESAVNAKWIQASGKPLLLYMPESIGSWGHWSITTTETLKGMCAIALAHGGAVEFNHVAPPCGDYRGKVFPGVYKLLGDVMHWIQEREHLCTDRKSVPVTAVLHSTKNFALQDAYTLACNNGNTSFKSKALGVSNSRTASQLLIDSRITTDFLYNENSLERLDEYEAIVLPNTGYMEPDFADKIREYAANGGKVLATYNTSLLDSTASERENFLLSDLFGADFVQYSDYSLTYLDQFEEPLKQILPDLPMLIKDAGYQENSQHKAIYCKLHPTAKTLAFFTEPVIESSWDNGYHIYHDHAPPGRRTDWPAVIMNQYGKGMCAFLPFPLIQAYEFQPNPWHRKLIQMVLGIMDVPTKIYYRSSPAINLVATQDDEGWLIHLIKIQKETESMFLDDTIQSGPVDIVVSPPWIVDSVYNALTGKAIPFSIRNETVYLEIENVPQYEIIRIAKHPDMI